MKSGFSIQPSQFSSQSFRIFFKSLTLSFFKSTVFRSIVFSVNHKIQANEDESHQFQYMVIIMVIQFSYHIEVHILGCPFSSAFHKFCPPAIPKTLVSTCHPVFPLQTLLNLPNNNTRQKDTKKYII